MSWGIPLTARFDGECSECGCDILEGDDIFSDGQRGWLCDWCGMEDE